MRRPITAISLTIALLLYSALLHAIPDYVDVAPVGPTQIGHYQELGYILIRVERY